MNTKVLWHSLPERHNSPAKVTVIGAGIAAWNIARALRKRAIACEIIAPFDPQTASRTHRNTALAGASGNPQAVVMPVLTARRSPEEDLLVRCFDYARRHYPATAWHGTGVLRHTGGAMNWQKGIEKRLSATVGDQTFPVPVRVEALPDGVFFPDAGWLQTEVLNQTFPLEALPWITAQVATIRQDPSQADHWLLLDQSGQTLCRTPAVVVASGIGLAGLRLQWTDAFGQRQDQGLAQPWRISARHGQVSFVRLKEHALSPHVVIGTGYLTPPIDGVCSLGATFDHLPEKQWQQPARLSEAHFARNLALWRETPWWESLRTATVTGGRAGIRASTPDHLPLAGPIIDRAHFQRHYADLHHGRYWQEYPPARPLPGLFVLGGLGSRGFTTAPWLAEQVVRQLCGEAIKGDDLAMLKSVHPNRFLFRQMQRPPQDCP